MPGSEPEGGWCSDTTDPARLGSVDYNAAVDVVNTRPELLSIDALTPEQPRPSHIQLQPSDAGWIPGVLVVGLSATRNRDEDAIRTHWGGPVCLAVAEGLSLGELMEIEADVVDLEDGIGADAGILGIGVVDGEVQVGVWVATVEAQARLDKQFGPEVVRLMGMLWAID